MFSWTRKVHFLERIWKFFVNVRAFLAQSLQKIKEFSSLQSFFPKNCYELVEYKTGCPEEVFQQKSLKFQFKIRKSRKSYQVFQKLFFFNKTFLWTRRTQFGQPTRNLLTEAPGISSFNSERHGKKHASWKSYIFLSKRCSGHIESKFDKPFAMFLLKVPQLTNQVVKLRRKFPEVLLLDIFMQFRERTRKFLPFFKCFCLKVWGRKKN